MPRQRSQLLLRSVRGLAVAGLLLSPNSALSQSDDAIAAYHAGDYATAARLWLLLAERGDVFAQSSLAKMFDYGQGVPEDPAEAAHWYMRAGELGLPSAQTRLGLLYSVGRGVPQDHVEAVRWYMRAAEQGFSQAQRLLGLAYVEGMGVNKDYIQAYKWLKLSMIRDLGDPMGPSHRVLARRMTPEQVGAARKLARDWKPKTWLEVKRGEQPVRH